MKNKSKHLVLQVGESTHTHVLDSELDIEYEEIDNGAIAFELKALGVLTHEEHKKALLEQGVYCKFPQVEFDPMIENFRQVFD